MTLMEQIITIVDLYCVRAIYSIIAILDLSCKSSYSRVYPLSRQSITRSDVWDASGVLL